MIAVLCLFLVSLAAPTFEQNAEDPSPCPHVFMYGPSRAKPGRWYGVVTLSTEITLHSLWLNIVLDNEAWVLGNSVGNVTTQDNKNFQIENAAMRIIPGVAETLYFYVQYNPTSITPRLLAIRLNGKEICNFILTPIKRPFKPPHKDVSNINDKPTDPVTQTQNQGNIYPNDPQGPAQCGQVVNGAHKGEQWPWQIALYKVHETNEDNKYICGGTLVSSQHVITAAHCVTRKSTKRVVELHTLTVYLGKQNLRTTVDGVQIGFVKEIIVHPNYNASTFSSDVAILELNPMAYTEWVRPACLWPKHDTDLTRIVGKEGTVVGWVFNDGGQVINNLVQEKTPVVSQERCIGSYNSFFSRFTSDYTYCAGNRKEMSTCPSAGSGMVFKNGNAWYLRGLISLSVPKLNAFQCDPKHYTIFTDLAKFSPWISSITKI